MYQRYLSMREVAAEADIEPIRLARLGRQIGLWSGEKLIPSQVVLQIKEKADPDVRYAAIRHWLLVNHQTLKHRGKEPPEPEI